MAELPKRAGLMRCEFTATPWKYDGPGAWHFVSFPKALSQEIRAARRWDEEGWGRLKAVAKTGGSEWETAVWFDTKHETYLLPIKAAVRKKEKIELAKDVTVSVLL